MVDIFFKIFKFLQLFDLFINKITLSYKFLVALWLEQWIAMRKVPSTKLKLI